MGSKYPRSLRCCLPLWAFVLQTAFIFLFWFVISQDTAQVDHKFMANYQGKGLGGSGQMVGQRRSEAHGSPRAQALLSIPKEKDSCPSTICMETVWAEL